MNKYLKTFFIGLSLLIVVIFIERSPMIFQEGNPLPVAYGIIKLSLTGDGYGKIDNFKYIVGTNEKDIQKFKDYLAKNKLVQVDQMGAGYFFKDKNGERITAEARMYSTKFMIFDFSGPSGFVLP